MTNDQVIKLLQDYRCYKYALNNVIEEGVTATDYKLPVVFSERRRNTSEWDRARYTKVIGLLDGAINEVLSDDQRTVIMRKYIDRNTMSLGEIANIIHRDRTTVGRWHTDAIRKLTKALMPLSYDEIEITNFDHMWSA